MARSRPRGGAGPGDVARNLRDGDLGVVADHEPVRARLTVVATDLGVAAEQRGLHPAGEVADGGAGEENRVLDLGGGYLAALSDRGVGPDVAVGQTGAGADH